MPQSTRLHSHPPVFRSCWSVAVCILFLGAIAARAVSAEPRAGWRAGVAVAAITPREPMMLAGFGSRKTPAEGKATDLFAKALALQDAQGTRLVIVTMDLIGVPRPLREQLAERVEKSLRLPAASLLINASHTHCGPELRMTPSDLEEVSPKRRKQTTAYCRQLGDSLFRLVERALDALQPATLHYSFARAGFAMNRRLKNPAAAGDPVLNHPNPAGPVDHQVPVLQVVWANTPHRAVLFGYACHNTTLFVNQYAGDYAGFAQAFLEKDHPHLTALFLTGCGGDQNGYPRGTLELARRHGRTLATAVEAALGNRKRTISGPLKLNYGTVELPYDKVPTREQLAAHQTDPARSPFKPYELTPAHAARLMRQLVRNGKLPSSYRCPIQTIRFGQDLVLVALSGETVVDYSLRLKRELAGRAEVWVSGYNNDVFAYVPSRRLLSEGGYEPRRSMNYYTATIHPGPFAPSIEDRIVSKVHQLLGTKPAAGSGDRKR